MSADGLYVMWIWQRVREQLGTNFTISGSCYYFASLSFSVCHFFPPSNSTSHPPPTYPRLLSLSPQSFIVRNSQKARYALTIRVATNDPAVSHFLVQTNQQGTN